MKPQWTVGLCVSVAILVCLPALRGGFVIDDAYVVVGNPGIRSLGNIPGFFVQPWAAGAGGAGHVGVNAAYFRPLTTALHWGLPDPAAVSGSETERLNAFRKVRDELQRRIGDVFAQPGSSGP
jgi:hypothetical protein